MDDVRPGDTVEVTVQIKVQKVEYTKEEVTVWGRDKEDNYICVPMTSCKKVDA